MRTGHLGLVCALGLFVAGLTGCAARAPEPPRAEAPDTHVVQRGETLYRIATSKGLDWRDVARRNGIGPPYLIYPGQRLRLAGAMATSSPPPATAARAPTASGPADPPAARTAPTPAATPAQPPPVSGAVAAAPAAAAQRTPPAPAEPVRTQWQWPADGPVLRPFSNSSATRRGIAIAGQRGDDVRAANAGEVVYAGSGLVGYGRLIIVKHDARFISAYGHNEELLVSEGDRVRAGERIARLGDSGADRPMLHFEIRVDGIPVDPTRYLPRR